MRISPYVPEMEAAVVHLLRLNTPAAFAPAEEEDYLDFLNIHREYYFVQKIKDQIVGCGGFNLVENNTHARISWDIQHPDFQGKGLGTALLRYRIQEIGKILSVTKLTVRTSQTAYQFYQKNGFVLQNIEKNYWAEGFDLYQMELFSFP